YANSLHDLTFFRNSLRLVARKNFEHSLACCFDSAQVTVRVTRKLLGGFSRSRSRVAHHFRLQRIESGEDERRSATSVFSAGRKNNARAHQLADMLARIANEIGFERANHNGLPNDIA